MAERYRRNVLEMSLNAIRGAGPWMQGAKASGRVVTVTLVWPRPLVASRVAAQTQTFAREGLDVTGLDWSERILFKESVEGPFGVIVQISDSLTAQQLARVAGALGEVALKAVGTEAARIAVGTGVSALAKLPFTYLAGELATLGKSAKVVAAGRTTLIPGEPGVVEIPLVVPEDVVRVRRSKRAGRVQTRHETLHKQGEAAGSVLLDVGYYRE